ncbi:hypothetical protein E2C01_036630 [Portunus trituberculatus]|uniref:Uncharacterized protein n=1 Tax=Portunus trituberculatus TaxID=210409 RepID=A0A5B7FBX2_PORTR|nr:hypothetical protein [Portunus trituberculatus]
MMRTQLQLRSEPLQLIMQSNCSPQYSLLAEYLIGRHRHSYVNKAKSEVTSGAREQRIQVHKTFQ